MNKMSGVIAAMVTPIDQRTQKIDFSVLGDLVDFLVEKGIHGLFPGGTTGEGPLLGFEERKSLIQNVVERASGRVSVLAHTGSSNPLETLELSRFAYEVGASAVSAVTPFFYRFTDAELLNYYKSLAEACPDLAIYVYNIPQRTGNPISGHLLKELARIENIYGIKDSSGDLNFLADAIQIGKSSQLDLFVGDDRASLYGLKLGAEGVVSSIAGIVPEAYLDLYRLVKSNRLDEAQVAQERIDILCDLFANGTSMCLFKKGLALRGIKAGAPRWPFVTDDPASVEQIRQFFVDKSYL